MNSALFRRRTRKGGRCMRGGSRSLDGEIANLTKSIAYLSKRRNDPLYYRQQAKNNAQIAKQTILLKSKQREKSAINQAAKEAAKAQANFNKSVQNAAQAMKEEAANASTGKNKGVITNVISAVKKSITGTNTSGQNAVAAANQAVVTANVAVNKTKKLQELATRARKLANNINSVMKGGKRSRRTYRK